jgi:Cu/Ag efflux pump CusA
LWIASGAGSIARQVIGTTVIGGMVAETFIGRFFVPAIFVAIERLAGARRSSAGVDPPTSPAQGD